MLDTEFTCGNGHNFRANAKLRARCPECGQLARRSFTPKPAAIVEKPEPPVEKPEPKPEPKPAAIKKPVLLRQGKPRMPVRKPKPALIPAASGKVAGGLVKSRRIRTRGTMPVVKGKPIKTAAARTIEHGSPRSSRPYWHDVAEKYGI